MGSLGEMQPSDQNLEIGAGGHLGGVARGEMADALLAAGDVQQAPVECIIPMPVEAEFGEGGVECRAVPVSFGFRQRAINIEDQRV